MSTYDLYTTPVEAGTWDVPSTGAARFSWEYDEGRQRLIDLYQRGKDKQWDATKRIDWDLPVDPCNVMATSEELNPIYGSRQWEVLSEKERDELGQHLGSWLFSQFLHGEQGALTVAARIVESVPDMDSKFYAATQAMDEARHVELYHRFIRDKIGLYYPINQDLARLLADALSDSRWDMPYLGMQVLIEGLALAAFGVHRDLTGNALPGPAVQPDRPVREGHRAVGSRGPAGLYGPGRARRRRQRPGGADARRREHRRAHRAGARGRVRRPPGRSRRRHQRGPRLATVRG